jgi:hypothetical protein
LQKKYLGDPLGYYYTEVGPLNQVVHLWAYEDLADMERRRAARNADPAWAEFRSLAAGCVHTQEDKLVRPAPFFTPVREPRGTIVDHRTYTFNVDRLNDWLGLFEEFALPLMRRYIGEPVGFYLTEVGHVNTVTHLWAYESLAEMQRRRAARNADPAWAEYLKKQGGMLLHLNTKLLRLAPFFAA